MAHRRFHGPGILGSVLLAVWVMATGVAGGAHNPVTRAVEPDWVFECAACPHNFYDLGPRSAQFDADGVLHVVYGGEALYHAWQSNDGWQVEIVEDRLQVGSQAALVIAGDGTLHVFYLDEEAQSLRYATGMTGDWVMETVAANIGDEPWPSPAVTADGQVHVAFRDGIQDQLVYAGRNTPGWQFSTVDGGGEHPSLAVDAEGRPHVSYVTDYEMWVGGELRYAYVNGSWYVEMVQAGVRSPQSALALGIDRQPHLVYAAPSDNFYAILKYAYRDSSGWHHEVADAIASIDDLTSGIGYDVSLALDSAGQPQVAYTSSHSSVSSYPLRYYYLPRYAARDAKGWSVALINDLSEYGDAQKTALVLDGGGQPHVFYRHVGDLVHRFNTGIWQSEVVALGGVAGISASMALDASGRAHISYIGNSIDSYWRKLLYTRRHSGGWDSEMVGWSSQDSPSLAVAADGYPHVLYNTYGRFTSDLAYSYRDEAGWHSTSVSDGNLHDVAVSVDGQVHAVWRATWYQGVTAPALYYKRLRPVPDVEPEIAGASDVRHASLAVDAAARPHVTYATGSTLVYTVRYDDGWQDEIVTSSFGVGSVALAVDGRGQPHIAFQGAASSDLFYAYRDSSGWRLEQVDWAGDVGQYTSIAVTDSGQPHISYYDATNQDLKYARRDGTGWSVETVASEGNVGLYTSIAIYNGYPHISYHDATRGDLMYVYKPFIPVAFSYLPLVAR